MKLGILFSGGKDSCLALAKALEFGHEVVCLINIVSENKASYMFHTPNVEYVKMQAEAIGLPLIQMKTKGKKEIELKDLEKAVKMMVSKYKIEGIVTGAIASVYQAQRVQKICNKLKIECFNPLWQRDQRELLEELLDKKFEIVIVGVFAYGLDEGWLGRVIDKKTIDDLILLSNKYRFNLAFEGGEGETFVLWAPFFKKRIEIVHARKEVQKDNTGVLEIEELKLVDKEK
jgi:ABC transporter with metal-binding/Fe-S-binding domain ATP-binding protein